MNNIYATNKLVYHPDLLKAFYNKESHKLNPIQIHLMPCNLCNHNCTFCSYRIDNWKNSEKFDLALILCKKT